MADELDAVAHDAGAHAVAGSGPSRCAIIIGAVVFAAMAATALTWAKCGPMPARPPMC